MATSFHRDSAQIYDLAARRALTLGHREFGRMAEPAPPALPTVECGSGWYHEAAMREEEQARAATRTGIEPARAAGVLLAFAPPSGTA